MTNSWLGGNGNWQTQAQWSLNQLPGGTQDVVIASGGTFTITIDDQTATNFPLTLTISSLLLSNFAGSGTLLLTNPPTSATPVNLTISNNAALGAGSVLEMIDASSAAMGVLVQAPRLVADGTLSVLGNTTLSLGGGPPYALRIGSATTGVVNVVGGAMTMNSSIAIGDQSAGYLTTSNGLIQCANVDVGAGTATFGSWHIGGGTNNAGNLFTIARGPGSTGEVVVTGGYLTALDLKLAGFFSNVRGGCATLLVSNGTVAVGDVRVGASPSSVGTVTVAGGLLNGGAFMRISDGGTGTVWLTGGEIDVTNSTGQITVGDGLPMPNHNQLICSGGVLRANVILAGRSYFPASPVPPAWLIAGGTSIVNTLTLTGVGEQFDSLLVKAGQLQVASLNILNSQLTASGGVVTVGNLFQVGSSSMATGTLVIAGGSVSNASGPAYIGSPGTGQLLLSSGTLTTPLIAVGNSPGTLGLLSITGGVLNVMFGGPNALVIAYYMNSTGQVQYLGGTLNASSVTVGRDGTGVLQVGSNPDLSLGNLTVAEDPGSSGTVTIHGGSLFSLPTRMISTLNIAPQANSTGTVWVIDGALKVFNPFIGGSGSGRLSVTNSMILLEGGTIGSHGTLECVNSQLNIGSTVNNNNVLRLVQSTGTIAASIQNSGTVIVDASTITAYASFNNSGLLVLTNGSATFFGSLVNSGAVLVSPDLFRITSVSPSGDDLLISWPVCPGNRYRVQASTSLANGFSDISAEITGSGTAFTTTNYLDLGALTNSPARYYRIRQVY